MINVNVELEVYEIISNCRRTDKTKLLRELLKNMSEEDIRGVLSDHHTDDRIFFRSSYSTTIHEENFNLALLKLGCNYMQLSVEDQNTIEQISKKY